jgi:beta-glucanase (GH16 family)
VSVALLAVLACGGVDGSRTSDPTPAASGAGAAGASGSAGTSGGASSGGAGSPSTTGGALGTTGGVPSSTAGSAGTEATGSAGAEAGADSGSGGSGPSGDGGASGAITVPDGYELVWHDEFEVDGAPSPTNWKFEKGFVRNEEDQWYQAANASVHDGLLVIEARRERVENPNYTGTGDYKTSRRYADYTSSSLHTNGLQSFQYGRFELRARIPVASGMWPAWWTLGVSGEWPSNGEIDIMEFYQGKVLANIACGTATRWQAKWDSVSKPVSTLGASFASSFHVWRMDWDETNIALYLDDQPMNSAALSSMLNADGSSPFKQKAYMLVNLAIGGMNGGDPSATTFPQRYEVDYVRVFQRR